MYVSAIVDELAQSAGVPDVRLADAGPCAFGKWRAQLALLARANPPEGDCVIHSGDLSAPIIEALATMACEVVRGGL